MNKFVFVVAMIFTGSAFAGEVPLPPKRPACFVQKGQVCKAPKPVTPPVTPTFNSDPNVYGAVVKDGKVIIRAPQGSDVQMDVDGKDVEIDITKNKPWYKFW